MKKKELISTCHNINKTLFWSDFIAENPENIKDIQAYNSFTFLQPTELKDAIDKIKNFDINLIWDRKFWGLKIHESISAIAVPYSEKIKRIKQLN